MRDRGRGRHCTEGADGERCTWGKAASTARTCWLSEQTQLPVLLNHWLFLTDNLWITHLKIHCVQFLLWDYSNDPLQASYSRRQVTNAQQHLPEASRTNPLWMPPHLIVSKNQIFQTVFFQMLMEKGKSKSACTHRCVFANNYTC